MTEAATPRVPGWYPTETGETRFWDGQSWSDRPFPAAQPASAPAQTEEAPIASQPTERGTLKTRWRALHKSGVDRYLIALAVIVVIGIVWAVVANHHDSSSSAAGARAGRAYGQVHRAAAGAPDINSLTFQCQMMAGIADTSGDASSGLAPHTVNQGDFVAACVSAAQSG